MNVFKAECYALTFRPIVLDIYNSTCLQTYSTDLQLHMPSDLQYWTPLHQTVHNIMCPGYGRVFVCVVYCMSCDMFSFCMCTVYTAHTVCVYHIIASFCSPCAVFRRRISHPPTGTRDQPAQHLVKYVVSLMLQLRRCASQK